ncbi:MAG TPA: DNA mismatch repair endonuclease MutL [Bacillota bacterium]|nr:DNA mismatch repair endonuclease MutL [Bacillota bacterium]
MNNKVHRLDDDTINQIAAGEIVENPSSVVKELVENAIDAGSTRIEVEIKNGGRQLIKVTDNGSGMEREDAVLAIERHTTSKISDPGDLFRLKTLGFRGEALPSIAAVSHFEMITKPEKNEFGTLVEVKGGLLQKVKDMGAPNGTSIKVQDLFFNTPARLKYLKTIPTEAGYISELITRLALGYPEISFRLHHHEYEVVFSPGNGDALETMTAVFGKDVTREMIPVNHQEGSFKVTGFIGKPNVAKTNRSHEIFFINRRYFHSRILSAAVEKAYHTLLPIARYPFVVLFLEVDPGSVDINVHPSKMEVRFTNESELFKIFYHSILKLLRDSCLLSEWIAPTEEFNLKSILPPETKTPAENVSLQYQEFEPIGDSQAQISAAREALPASETYQVQTQDGLTSKEVFTPKPDLVLSPEAAPPRMEASSRFYVFPKAVCETFIIAEDEKGLLLIDQHAAHERILYERYYYQSNKFLGIQALLIPETVTLNHVQYRVVADRLTLFGDLGFELEVFGGNTVIMRGVPLSMVNLDYRQILQDLIEQFINFQTFKNPAEIKEEFIITMACRSAIKARDNLNHLEMEALVRDLFRTENPYTCPHGRPTVFRMSYDEIAKKFLRR